MSKRPTSNCHRCGAVLLPGAEVCSTCCAPYGIGTPEASFLTEHRSVVADPDAPAPTTGLGAWPFGQADAEAAAQVAARAVMADVRDELSHYSAQSATHVLAAIPGQRLAQPVEVEEVPSVPSQGPNPFLAAARIQSAREEATLVEGYPV
jgi:hypothetical protein